MLRAIVFDFDGVILESVDIKTRAFEGLFKAYPEHVHNIVQFHLANGGMSRFDKFKYFYREFLNKPLSERELEQLGNRFSELVFEAILRCPFVAGAREFLEKYSARYDLFVASGTPQEEMRTIVVRRGIEQFFQGVYGSPNSKGEIIQSIIERHQYRPSGVVFIGDAMTDYQGALEASTPFIGRVPSGAANPFPDDGVLCVVTDLRQLDEEWPAITESFSKQ